MFTIVLLSFHSEDHIRRLVSGIKKKYPIIIIENSLNINLKSELEEKYENIKVIIPSKNIGISAGYNLGINESKTNFVKITSADVNITNQCLQDLEDCISKIKNFSILAPTYDNETVYQNYRVWNPSGLTKKPKDENFEKYGVTEVDYVENDFIINKKEFEKLGFFDENIFMYYETMDLCFRARAFNKKNYVCKKIQFTHYGAQSVSAKYSYQYSLNRSWHYNWSKYYYFKKNLGYIFAIRKILPNFIRSLKKMIICRIRGEKNKYMFHKYEILGIISSVFNKKSNYRPFKTE